MNITVKGRAAAGSTAQLILFASFYFIFYTLYGLGIKFGQAPKVDGFPGLTELEFLVYSSLGSAAVCLGVIFAARWWRASWGRRELAFVMLAGTCTAFLIPTTTLLYSLPISVMVAIVLMRGSGILISRLVDTVLLAQGLSAKKVRWEENAAVALALLGVSLRLLAAGPADFHFFESTVALSLFGTYVAAYAGRLYLLNYFKFTRGPAGAATNKNYFAAEQLTAAFWVFGFAALLWFAPGLLPPSPGISQFRSVMGDPPEHWLWAVILGVPFGLSAFFSAFLFLFQGRTSTFAGLANHLSSLLAGTAATLLFALLFQGPWPKPIDWLSLLMILGAAFFLSRAEKKARPRN